MEPTRKELVMAGFVFMALPLLMEAGLRISGTRFEPQLYEPSRERGWTLRPGASGAVSGEARQEVRINGHGFRDRERDYKKSDGTFRIAVLGNSWTEALQVPLEKTYPAVLEHELQRRSCWNEKRIEVLNFGVAGYSTAQELLTLRQEVWKYRPDLVILAFYPARDIANNVRELNNAANPEQSPYYVYRDGVLVEDSAFSDLPSLQPRQISLQRLRYGIDDRVQVLQAINALQRMVKLWFATTAAKERAQKFGPGDLEFDIYAPPRSAEMSEAWKVTEGLLTLMQQEAKAHGAEFQVVVLATRPQVLPDLAKREELQARLGVKDFTYADRRLSEFGAKQDIPVILLSPALSTYAETHHVYLNGFNDHNWGAGHWNETGHRLAGEAIAADLCGKVQSAGRAGHE